MEYLIEILAREKSGQGPGWHVFQWENLGELKACRLTGVVAPPLKSGKNKGEPNWKKKDKATERTVYVTDAERDAYEAAWEQRTGECSRCMGEGTTPSGCRKLADGTYEKTRRPCPRCGGTGKAAIAKETA
jgi:hypothetical protein